MERPDIEAIMETNNRLMKIKSQTEWSDRVILGLIAYIDELEIRIYELDELIEVIERSDDLCYEEDPPSPKRVLELSEWHSILDKIRSLSKPEEQK